MRFRRRTSREGLEPIYAALGVDPEDAEDAIASELEEDLPQLAFAAVALEVWNRVDVWRDTAWVSRLVGDPLTAAGDPAARDAVRRAADAGVSAQDLAEIARYVAKIQAFETLVVIDDGEAVQVQSRAGVRLPGWEVRELDPDGKPTGRDLGGLHENFFGWEPGAPRDNPELSRLWREVLGEPGPDEPTP